MPEALLKTFSEVEVRVVLNVTEYDCRHQCDPGATGLSFK
jgi:hypothetical protein